jgi:hypothetical protein
MNETHAGNGNGKAFVLAQPKSPDEIAQDEVRKMAPRIRRECSRDPRLLRHVGAKWLFCQLTDDSFLNYCGGDGFGKIFTTLRELQKRYGHDSATLSEWLDKLIETGWVWVKKGWPVWCMGITSICRQPELFCPDHVRVQARASGQENKMASGQFVQENDEMAKNGPTDGQSPLTKWPVAKSVLAGDGQSNGDLPIHLPSLTATEGHDLPFHQPSPASTEMASGQNTFGRSRPAPTVTDGHKKETPTELRRSGEPEGGETPAPAAAQKALSDYFQLWEGAHLSRLQPEEKRLRGELRGEAQHADGERFKILTAQLHFIRLKLRGPVPARAPAPIPCPAPKAVRAVQPASTMTPEELKAFMQKCKREAGLEPQKNLPAALTPPANKKGPTTDEKNNRPASGGQVLSADRRRKLARSGVAAP